MKQNYQILLDKEIQNITEKGSTPKLLLHSCCAPCSSYPIEYLTEYFDISVFYFNPNIEPDEYVQRLKEQHRFCEEFAAKNRLDVIEGEYNPSRFFEVANGLEECPEGSERCFKCYRLRLEETAKTAKDLGYDYFATTLTLSPLKNAEILNKIGEELMQKYNICYLYSDFKKKGGYLRSTKLSKEYNLYRQNYCGCVYSK